MRSAIHGGFRSCQARTAPSPLLRPPPIAVGTPMPIATTEPARWALLISYKAAPRELSVLIRKDKETGERGKGCLR